MTTQISVMDRDEFLAVSRAEQVEQENESEISKLVRQITEARHALTISELTLAAIQESLSGKSNR